MCIKENKKPDKQGGENPADESNPNTGDSGKWETDEEILQGDSMPPYHDPYSMQKWAGYGFPECYLVKCDPEMYARRRRIYRDYRDGLRPLREKTVGVHQIRMRNFLEGEKEEEK